ncbi:MAG: hypothetical protein PHG66_00575 [Candidatus Colwellbacteria bacterium]|nr:hypothetical protein [Candidatus Colwellbacteria bacterium]
METSQRKRSEDIQESLKKITSLLEEYLDEYSEDLYNKEEDGLVDFLLSRFQIKTVNYYERIFSVLVDDEWIEIHPTSIHHCFSPIVDLMEKEYPLTQFYYRCEQRNYQLFTSKLSWALIQKFIPKKIELPRLSSNKTLESLMEEMDVGTKFAMEE